MDAIPHDCADDEQRAELQRLGEELSVRSSATHYAVGFASAMVGIVTFGVAMRLLVDSERLPLLFWPIALVAAACVVVSLHGLFKARRLQLDERTRFQHYLALRAKAGLD